MKHLLTYNAPPSDDKFHEVDEAELAEIIRSLQATLNGGYPSSPMLDASALSEDIAAATRAAELMDSAGLMILVAQDEDGYYFALGENERYRDWIADEKYRKDCANA